MSAVPLERRVYDPQVRRLVVEEHRDDIVRELRIPRSTVSGWRARPLPPVVSISSVNATELELQAKIATLESRLRRVTAIMVLLLVVARVSRRSLRNLRVPNGDDKRRLLHAIDRAARILPKEAALKIAQISSTRYNQWRRSAAEDCPMDDRSTCPKTYPTMMTSEETRQMHDMATATEYRHVPTSTLAMLAQRLGNVFASASTWCKYVRDRHWRRPRRRVYPKKPTRGIRVDSPDGLWHVDTSLIRTLDGSRAYLRAIIDNYSRRILAWWIGERLEPMATAALLVKAMESRDSSESDRTPQSLMVDGGIENFNEAVDKLVDKKLLKRLLAQTDVMESNSLIERFWLSAKHNWLFLNDLRNLSTVRRLVAFYIEQYNAILPHSALNGRTPDEVYFGVATDTHDKLAAARSRAREARMAANRARVCEDCCAATITPTPAND